MLRQTRLLHAPVLLVFLSCQPIPDPIIQSFGQHPLELPQAFGDLQRSNAAGTLTDAREFANRAYGSDDLDPFAYGDSDINGFALAFETDFEAQRRHRSASRSIQGTIPVPSQESTTVADYDGVYFFESENPTLMFHIANHTIFLKALSTGISRTSSLRRALAFVEQVFEINNRLGTRPLRPFQLDPLRYLPANAEPITPGPTHFELDLAFILEDQPSANVSAQVRWFKAGRGLIVYTDSARVQRGTGKISFAWDVDLTEGAISDILSLRAHISYQGNDGQLRIPGTSLLGPIRYSIARTNN